MTGRNQLWTEEDFALLGRVGAPAFPPWIARHAAKLGLTLAPGAQEAGRLTFRAAGPPELLDALEVGCLLGPMEVWVDSILRLPTE